MGDPRIKIISDIETGDNVASVKNPFKLFSDQKRHYIRLEISEPVHFSILKDDTNGFWPEGNGPEYEGSILNLSAGGILITSGSPVKEGMILLLRMSLQDIEILDNIVGLVKRVDGDGDEWLIGIEFISREYLKDVFSHSEIEVLLDGISSFDECLRKTLNKYVFYKRVSKENG